MTRTPLTLVYLFSDDGRLLLGMKKRGFGAGRWNGFGGKLKDGESLEAAAHRELAEEVGLSAAHLTKQGVLEFEFEHNRGAFLEVHVFRAAGVKGTPTESDEMRPQWFEIQNIPYQEMWESDRQWFPLFLSGKAFRGRFLFGEGDRVRDANVEEVTAF